MKVLVAGGTGFIGRHLVSALKMRGDAVTVLARDPEDVRRAFAWGIEPLEWHPPHPGPWMDAVSSADAVVNLAGRPVVSPTKPWTETERAAIRGSRVDSTRAIVEAIRVADPRPRVLVNQSASGYYGSRGNVQLTEASPPGNDFLASVVRDWEAAAKPAEELGVRLVLPRTSIVLGTDGGLLPMLETPFKLYAGGIMGKPDQWFSWIHIQDEVDLIIHALDHDTVHGPLNASSPHPVTMREFSRVLGAVLHKPVWVPLIWVGMKLLLGKRAEAVLTSQRLIPEETLRAGYIFRHPQVEEALRSLLAPAAAQPSAGAGGPSL